MFPVSSICPACPVPVAIQIRRLFKVFVGVSVFEEHVSMRHSLQLKLKQSRNEFWTGRNWIIRKCQNHSSGYKSTWIESRRGLTVINDGIGDRKWLIQDAEHAKSFCNGNAFHRSSIKLSINAGLKRKLKSNSQPTRRKIIKKTIHLTIW